MPQIASEFRRSHRRHRRFERQWVQLLLLVTLCLLRVGSAAAGETSAAVEAQAEALFRAAKRKMAEADYAAACAGFAESQRLDPALGTLLNLAHCHEKRGLLASAWAEYQKALTLARRARQPERVSFAQERLNAIEPRLSHLVLERPTSGLPSGYTVEVDGIPIREGAFGVAMPMDPGRHQLIASAPGYVSFRKTIEFEEAQTHKVTLPALTAADSPPPETRTSPVVYWAAGGTLLLAAGAVTTGMIALDRRSTYLDKNNDPEASVVERADARSDANAWYFANAGFTAASIVGAGVTLYLWLSGSDEDNPKSSFQIAPWTHPTGGGLWAQGNL